MSLYTWFVTWHLTILPIPPLLLLWLSRHVSSWHCPCDCSHSKPDSCLVFIFGSLSSLTPPLPTVESFAPMLWLSPASATPPAPSSPSSGTERTKPKGIFLSVLLLFVLLFIPSYSKLEVIPRAQSQPQVHPITPGQWHLLPRYLLGRSLPSSYKEPASLAHTLVYCLLLFFSPTSGQVTSLHFSFIYLYFFRPVSS